MARCKDEACNEVERLPEGAAIAESSLSEDDYLEKSRTFPLRVNENVVFVVAVALLVLLLLTVAVAAAAAVVVLLFLLPQCFAPNEWIF